MLENDELKIVKTDDGAKDGQNKCPKCGSTEISLNANNGLLRCNFCRNEFEPEKVEGLETDITKLEGDIIASGTQDIINDTEDILTLKCSSCGAEVVVDTTQSTQSRCHWCRSTLSINQQIPNGAIPDVVLPFKLTKAEAKKQIEAFVNKRKFYANPRFKAEFTTENIMGVYFPYMVVDINSHASFSGEGERLIRKHYRKVGDRTEVLYDADLYEVEREFDLAIEGLTVESSKDKLNKNAKGKTNNVINAIMPFDMENSVKWNSNYLKGYTSERRDTNIDELKPLVDIQAKDISRHSANETLKEYDRGVRWDNERLNVKGTQWKAAYLPVWLYSYREVKGQKELLHYVAVNARTKETMGSIPLHMPKLFLISAIVEIIAIIINLIVDAKIILLTGLAYFLLIYFKYRNTTARHKHEKETKTKMLNLKKIDNLIKQKKNLSNPVMQGANNTKVGTQGLGSEILNQITQNNTAANFIKNQIDKDNK